MPYKYQDMWHQQMRKLEKQMIQRHRKSSTIRDYRVALTTIWKLLGKPNNPHDVPLKDYQAVEEKLQKEDYSENTIVTYTDRLLRYLRFINYKDVDEIFIISQAHPKEDRVFLEEDQVMREREIAHQLGTEYELVYSLAVDNSLRRSDICNITLAEAICMADTRKGWITQKGSRRRQIVIHRNTVQLLKEYLKERDAKVENLKKRGIDSDPYLFLNRMGKHISAHTIYNRITKISDISGEYFRPHDLRATCVRRHARAGTRPETVMMITGHSNFSTTFVYYYGKDTFAILEAQDKI